MVGIVKLILERLFTVLIRCALALTGGESKCASQSTMKTPIIATTKPHAFPLFAMGDSNDGLGWFMADSSSLVRCASLQGFFFLPYFPITEVRQPGDYAPRHCQQGFGMTAVV